MMPALIAAAPRPTPQPQGRRQPQPPRQPSPAPRQPRPAPRQPRPAPRKPRPAPRKPRPAPRKPPMAAPRKPPNPPPRKPPPILASAGSGTSNTALIAAPATIASVLVHMARSLFVLAEPSIAARAGGILDADQKCIHGSRIAVAIWEAISISPRRRSCLGAVPDRRISPCLTVSAA